MPSTIVQEPARQMLSFGCSVRRALTKSAWSAHCQPYNILSEPWSVVSEADALLLTSRRCWTMYCEIKGVGLKGSRTKNMFQPTPHDAISGAHGDARAGIRARHAAGCDNGRVREWLGECGVC